MDTEPIDGASEFTWNQEQIKISFPEAKNLQDVMSSISGNVSQSGSVVCEVTVNGMRLTEEEEARFSYTPVQDIDSLTIRAQDTARLLDTSLDGCHEYLNQLIVGFEKAALLFRSEDLNAAHSFYSSCIEAAQHFIDLITHYKVVHQSVRGALTQDWDNLEGKLRQTLCDILEAYKKKDYILVADLLEYELINNLSCWQALFSRGSLTKGEPTSAPSERQA